MCALYSSKEFLLQREGETSPVGRENVAKRKLKIARKKSVRVMLMEWFSGREILNDVREKMEILWNDNPLSE